MKTIVIKSVIATAFVIMIMMPCLNFANSVENVEQSKTVSFRIRTNTVSISKEPVETEILVYYFPKYGSRMDTYVSGEIVMRSYTITKDKSIVMIFPQAKMYIRMLLTDKQLNEEDGLRELTKLFMSLEHKELEHKTIDGMETKGIKVDSPRIGGGIFESAVGQLWSNVKTGLPVRVEIEGTSLSGNRLTKIFIDRFQWDQKSELSEFEPNIPADYNLFGVVDASDKDAEAAINGLRTFAELSDSRYPSSLAPMTLTEEISKVLKNKYQTMSTKEALDKVVSINSAGLFYTKLINENRSVEYHGTSVTAKDVDTELMRWNISDDEYKVVFGDLRIETIGPKQLALRKAISMGAKIPRDKRWVVTRMLNLKESDLIKGLSVFVRFSNGQYPSSMVGKTMIKEANEWLKKYGKIPKGDVEKEISNLIFAIAYYDKLVREKKDVKYYGDKISVEDVNAVLVRWKISNKKYRVVFSDLRTEDVSSEELSVLEKLNRD